MVCHLTLFTICAFLRALLFRLRAGKKGFKRGRLFREVNLRCWAGNKKRIEIGQVTRQCSAVLRLPWLCGVRRASCCCSNRAARLLTALVSIDRTGFDRFAACALAVTARRQPLLGPDHCAWCAQPLPRSRALEVRHWGELPPSTHFRPRLWPGDAPV